MATRMLQRRGTAAEWAAQNPTLAEGELGFVTDENKIKIGDGETAWDSLPYFNQLSFSDLLDVDTTGVEVDATIKYNGSNWVVEPPVPGGGGTDIAMIIALGG